MAIVSLSKKFIFLKTRKTAGTSIQESLLPQCETGDVVTREWTDLMTSQRCVIQEFASLEEIEHHFNLDRSSFFTFGFTRNPYDLILSRYFYQIKMNRIAGPATKADFNRWVRETYFVGEPGFPGGRYLKDRSRLLLFDERGNPKVDFIGKVEHLAEDFRYAVQRIGLREATTLRHVNKSNQNRVEYRQWLAPDCRELVQQHFDFEIDYFQYGY